jgi:hypothetical protein
MTDLPEWFPGWLKEALRQPTCSVPVAGAALYKADRGQSYALARRGVIPAIQGGRRLEVPTVWVRGMLRVDDPQASRCQLSGARTKT